MLIHCYPIEWTTTFFSNGRYHKREIAVKSKILKLRVNLDSRRQKLAQSSHNASASFLHPQSAKQYAMVAKEHGIVFRPCVDDVESLDEHIVDGGIEGRVALAVGAKAPE